jgi:SAM-dependent methyltransferase
MPRPTATEGYRLSYRPYMTARRRHWDAVAEKMDRWHSWGGYYHKRLAAVYRFLIPPAQRVLEIGCANGNLLAAVHPAFGVGIDISHEMIKRAKSRHVSLHFVVADAHHLPFRCCFDAVILSDLVNDLWDIIGMLEELLPILHRSTRLVINCYSRLWELPLTLSKRLGKSNPLLQQNWVTTQDISGMLRLSGIEPIRHWPEVLLPVPIPLVSAFANRILAKVQPLPALCLTNFIVARPSVRLSTVQERPTVSIIIPTRNEAGNIRALFDTVPAFDKELELIFVEGNSTDNTFETIDREIAAHPNVRCRLLKQQGRGKADAVRLGFDNAQGDVLMILDADLTVQPHDLARFYDVLATGEGDFINGVRLVYPMERHAMRYVNLVGNKLFCLMMSWIIGQHVKDTLCGTKAFWKKDWLRIRELEGHFQDIDPFGDFDLLLGAARLNLKIVDIPVRYGQRTYGATNISRWRDARQLCRIVLRALARIKFI